MTDRQVLINRARQAHERTPILAQVPAVKKDGKVASMRLYDRIDSWGEDWGVSAKEFAAALDELGDDVEEIQLSINSGGGEVFEGIAILNSLRRHSARVTVTVDGIAASAASFIAMAGDEVTMARNSEMMIHKAWGLVVGNADDMAEMGERLLKDDRNIASIYADRAGGTVEDWLELMSDETWFTADEAVEAGLADRVEEKTDATDAKAKVDLSVFNHAGRANAPAPKLPTKTQARPTAGSWPQRMAERLRSRSAKTRNAPGRGTTPKEESDVIFTHEQLAAARSSLGLADDAELTADAVLAALSQPSTQEDGTAIVDAAALAERDARLQYLESADERRRRDERDQVIRNAMEAGKFAPAQREHFARLWDADPDGTRRTLDGLPKGLVPVEPTGYTDAAKAGVTAAAAVDPEFAHLFPPHERTT